MLGVRERKRERESILPLDLFHVEIRYVVSSILTHPPSTTIRIPPPFFKMFKNIFTLGPQA
jgi:hypothetical protein